MKRHSRMASSLLVVTQLFPPTIATLEKTYTMRKRIRQSEIQSVVIVCGVLPRVDPLLNCRPCARRSECGEKLLFTIDVQHRSSRVDSSMHSLLRRSPVVGLHRCWSGPVWTRRSNRDIAMSVWQPSLYSYCTPIRHSNSQSIG